MNRYLIKISSLGGAAIGAAIGAGTGYLASEDKHKVRNSILGGAVGGLSGHMISGGPKVRSTSTTSTSSTGSGGSSFTPKGNPSPYSKNYDGTVDPSLFTSKPKMGPLGGKEWEEDIYRNAKAARETYRTKRPHYDIPPRTEKEDFHKWKHNGSEWSREHFHGGKGPLGGHKFEEDTYHSSRKAYQASGNASSEDFQKYQKDYEGWVKGHRDSNRANSGRSSGSSYDPNGPGASWREREEFHRQWRESANKNNRSSGSSGGSSGHQDWENYKKANGWGGGSSGGSSGRGSSGGGNRYSSKVGDISELHKDLGAPAGGFKTKAEAKKHYARAASKNHPDKNPDDVDGANARMSRINAAWDKYKKHPEGFEKLASSIYLDWIYQYVY